MERGAVGGLTQRVEAELAREFRVLRVLGVGAVSHVFLARELALERLVALKVMRPELAEKEVARRRFAREARAAARIVHPNVAAVHRVGALADGVPWLVMEYVEGRTLADVLAAQGPLSPSHGKEVLAQVAAALAAAHEQGVIHRDVRPENILVERASGRVVLTDFGLAGLAETGLRVETRLTRTGEVLGETRYASPEQLLAEPTTPAADVYSLGVVGYELLAGRGPFGDLDPARMVAAHLKEAPAPLRKLRPEVDPAVARLLERCLDKEPARRPIAPQVVEALSPAPTVRSEPLTPPAAGGLLPAAVTSFLAELQRRRVYRAVVAYLAGTFVVLQTADIVLDALSAPSWVMTALVLASLAGLPIILVLAWVYDVGRGGIRRTPGVDAPPGGRVLRTSLQLLGLVASLALAWLLGSWLLR